MTANYPALLQPLKLRNSLLALPTHFSDNKPINTQISTINSTSRLDYVFSQVLSAAFKCLRTASKISSSAERGVQGIQGVSNNFR